MTLFLTHNLTLEPCVLFLILQLTLFRCVHMPCSKGKRSGPWAGCYREFENYYLPVWRGIPRETNDYVPQYTKQANDQRREAARRLKKRRKEGRG